MGLATPPKKSVSRSTPGPNPITSMSQGIHQGIFSFADGFDRPETQDQQHHIAQQSRRDKLRVPQGFDPAPPQSLVPIEDEGVGPSMYEPVGGGNMLSDMFNFPTPGAANSDLLSTQIPQANYRFPARPSANYSGGSWYGDPKNHQHGDLMMGMHSESAMQLFLTNQPAIPPHPRSPSPPPPHHNHGFHAFGDTSLSLSSSLQQFEMAKAEDGVLYFNNQHHHQLQQQQQQQQQNPSLQMQGQQSQQGQQVQNMGYGYMGVVNVLRNSKYARAAQELLEEFCNVGRGQLKGSRIGRHHGSSSNPNPNSSSGAGSAVAGSSSNSKEIPSLSPAERFEHQRKKAKLLSMLDEVDRRYNHYCDQMQMVVNSFDSVMGFGAALPYTALAQKAMSRHFRCLKDSVATQLKQTCELLGEKEGGTGSGITKGETPRLRLLDQSLRQQRAFHQMGMMEQEAWRPQRGLPERSVTILRAWLFEHFLHPYPSDADKHLLARQTGLSRNQVSNWFINARVRLWKPMVEEMYQQESKDEPGDRQWEPSASHQSESQSPKQPQQQQQQQRPENKKAESDLHHHHRFPSNPAVGEGPASDDVYRAGPSMVGPAGRARATGDVSLTLGLRHAGNAPDKGRFTIRDFGDC